LTPADLLQFIPRLLASIKIKTLIQGNIARSEAEQLAKDISEILKAKAIFPSQYPEKRLLKLKKGFTYTQQVPSLNDHDINSCIWNEYQVTQYTCNLLMSRLVLAINVVIHFWSC
jgi:secreted Zn-dependent insulinase-like peptidase